MHDPAFEGQLEFFKCDFCRRAWSEDRPMVEGHKGSLFCGTCLSAAYREVLIQKGGQMGVRGPVHPIEAPGPWCVMCLERREERYWTSPLYEEARSCTRCIRQSATMLSRDPESGWQKPTGAEEEPDGDEEEV